MAALLLVLLAAQSEPVVALYAVRLNGVESGEARMLRFPDGRVLARRVDLHEWRLQAPEVSPVLFSGEEYLPLDAFEGTAWKINESRQELTLDIPARHFRPTVIEGTPSRAIAPMQSNPGGFFNYDALASASNGLKRVDGAFEAGFFSGLGVASTTVVAHSAGPQAGVVRLESSWTRDFPAESRTLTIGDTVGAPGLWGRPVRFGGLRYGTNFATHPGFVPYPLPGLKGEAALPAAADLYVEGVLRQRSSVPPGPFEINEVPVVNGQGEVRLVVQDALGRERVVTQSYYATPRLLRRGLVDESYELGFVRDDFGISSNDYGRAVAAGQRRMGITDSLTGEIRAELLRYQQALGAGATAALLPVGLFTAAAAVSRSEAGGGATFLSGFERQSRQGPSFGLGWQWAASGFRQLGLQPGQLPPLRALSAYTGFPLGGYGSISVSYVRRDDRDRAGNEILSASYTVTIARSVTLSVAALRSLRGEAVQSVAVGLSVALGERTSASLNYSQQAQSSQALLQAQQNLPADSGAGYRVLAGTGPGGDREEGALMFQGDKGTYELGAARSASAIDYRASMSGSAVLIDGQPFLTRPLVDSFGVAQVPGFADVGVVVNNQPVGRTNRDGYIVLPHLMPYQPNEVRIDPSDLPIDAQIDSIRLEAVPYFRSGLSLSFAVQRTNGALLVVLLEDGAPVPSGAVAHIEGGTDEFPVVERGEVYVTGLARKTKVHVSWRGQSCELKVEMQDGVPPLPKLGPFTCAGVKR